MLAKSISKVLEEEIKSEKIIDNKKTEIKSMIEKKTRRTKTRFNQTQKK